MSIPAELSRLIRLVNRGRVGPARIPESTAHMETEAALRAINAKLSAPSRPRSARDSEPSATDQATTTEVQRT